MKLSRPRFVICLSLRLQQITQTSNLTILSIISISTLSNVIVKHVEVFWIEIYIFLINLYWRKKIGILATSKWGNSCPKFNSPKAKTDLNEFCAKIALECAIPEINFNEEGIANHVETFFSEQRRYKKNKSPTTKVCVKCHCQRKPGRTKRSRSAVYLHLFTI